MHSFVQRHMFFFFYKMNFIIQQVCFWSTIVFFVTWFHVHAYFVSYYCLRQADRHGGRLCFRPRPCVSACVRAFVRSGAMRFLCTPNLRLGWHDGSETLHAHSLGAADAPKPPTFHMGLLQRHQQADLSKTHIWTVFLHFLSKNHTNRYMVSL